MVRKAELPNVQDIAADAASLSQDADWKVFPLIAYGVRSDPNIALCPETWRIVQNIPGLRTAMFSILEPASGCRLTVALITVCCACIWAC
jgi:beta-hydroxylase